MSDGPLHAEDDGADGGTPRALQTRHAAPSAEALRERLAILRRAGAELRRRPAADTVDALGRVLDGFRAGDSTWRAELETALPPATGFTPETVREGLARGLAPLSGEALHALVTRELGGVEVLEGGGRRMAQGFDTTALLLAGSIPMPTLVAMLAPLVLSSPVLAKCASRDPVTAPLVARAIAEVDPVLGACVEVTHFPGDDAERTDALLAADCVVATGSDETIAGVSARARSRRLVGHGHRLSLAALGDPATRGEALARNAEALALDVALWDQLGCLSPVAVYVTGGGVAADRVASALAAALEQAGRRWPRGRVDLEDAARLADERASAELRAAAGAEVVVHRADDDSSTVVREEDARPRPAPLHRFVRVHPVDDADALLAALEPLARHLAAVAIAGFEALPALPRELARRGASRICAPGTLQAPPLDWRHEGRGVLTPLARFADCDRPPR